MQTRTPGEIQAAVNVYMTEHGLRCKHMSDAPEEVREAMQTTDTTRVVSDVESGRLVFEIEPDATSALSMVLPDKRPNIEMRASLQHGVTPLTETWTYAIKL